MVEFSGQSLNQREQYEIAERDRRWARWGDGNTLLSRSSSTSHVPPGPAIVQTSENQLAWGLGPAACRAIMLVLYRSEQRKFRTGSLGGRSETGLGVRPQLSPSKKKTEIFDASLQG